MSQASACRPAALFAKHQAEHTTQNSATQSSTKQAHLELGVHRLRQLLLEGGAVAGGGRLLAARHQPRQLFSKCLVGPGGVLPA